MASKTLNQFTPSTSAPLDTDYMVGYTAPIYGGERRWTVSQLKQALSTTGTTTTTLVPSGPDLPESLAPLAEMGFIKFLAKQSPSRNSGAAVTTTNRVIAWGLLNGMNGTNGGQLSPTPVTGSAIEPSQYIRVPFYSSWSPTTGADGVDYLDENPAVQITDLYWTTRVGLALLSDGTVWVAGYNNGGIGLGPDPGNTYAAYRPTCGFVKLTFAAGVTIKKIQCASDNSSSTGNNDTVFAALDTTDRLWMWGNTLDGVFGTNTATASLNNPTPMENKTVVIDTLGTTGSMSFNGQILDFSITGCESGGTAISIVKKDGTLWFGGDNTNYQRGAGTANAVKVMNVWNKAFKQVGGSSTAISDAVYVQRTYFSGRLNHFYTDTSGTVWACGVNTHGTLGDTGSVGVYAAKGFFTNVVLPTGYKAITTGPSVFMTGNNIGTVYALCKNTTTNVTTLISWGHNGNVGYCGANLTTQNVTSPTICKYRGANGNMYDLANIEKVFISDQTGNSTSNYGAVAVIDTNGYAYSTGYGNYNDPPTYSNNNKQFFIRLPMKNVKEVTLGSRADVITHAWTLMLQKSGVLWGMGDVANKLFGTADVAKHPMRIL